MQYWDSPLIRIAKMQFCRTHSDEVGQQNNMAAATASPARQRQNVVDVPKELSL